MKLIVLLINSLNFYFTSSHTLDPNCTLVQDSFASTSSRFIKCSIENSKPVTFCEGCIAEYINLLNSYKNISKTTNNGTNCMELLVNQDRLGIIQTLYENSLNLWNRAKCYECFIMENGQLTNKTSNMTQTFMEFYKDFLICQAKEDETTVCDICMDKYTLLQNYFLSISNENEKIAVCMDIVDLMNTTWTYWGNACCKFRRHNEYGFIVSTVVVLVGTILFYVLAQVCAKQKNPTILEQTRFLNTLES